MTELKPCPFCGGKRIIHGYEDNRPLGWCESHNFMCRRCGIETKGYPTIQQAIEAWNRRVSE